jgi:low affinity Fe/Cu permease
MKSTSWFARFAKTTSRAAGRPAAIYHAAGINAQWAITRPVFRFSDTRQHMIKTRTTNVTFMMVLRIQHTQNRDAQAGKVKLDELIRVTEGAHNALLDLEDTDDDRLEQIRLAYAALAEQARQARVDGRPDTDRPEVREENGEKKPEQRQHSDR